jgi:hypothetical protein
LEEAMDAIERGTYSTKNATGQYYISLISLLDHLNGKTRSMKMGPLRVLTNEKDATIVDGF